MPEIPDLDVYAEALSERIVGKTLIAMRVGSPFLLRSVSPPPSQLAGLVVEKVDRFGKRLRWNLEGGAAVAIHLMIAGRLQWKTTAPSLKSRNALAAWDFDDGSVLLTEAGKKRRAAVHLLADADELTALDRGGLDVQSISESTFANQLRSSRHTLKRALTDQRVFGGIGNAYSDEILHAAQLSPFKRGALVSDEEVSRLFTAVTTTLETWTERLRAECNGDFPKKVTAFRPEMSVHGKFREPCPRCKTPIQRIVYAENESNYCPTCQTKGKILADRALSKLLKGDWPKTVDELEGTTLGVPTQL